MRANACSKVADATEQLLCIAKASRVRNNLTKTGASSEELLTVGKQLLQRSNRGEKNR